MGFRINQYIKKCIAGFLTVMLIIVSNTGCRESMTSQNVNTSQKVSSFQNDDRTAMSSLGFPLTKTPVTLKMAGWRSTVHGDWNNMLVFKEYEKLTNVKVEFEAIPEDYYRDRINVMMASNDLPDAFLKGFLEPMDVAEYSANGALIPMETLIDIYAPNINKLIETYPEVKASSYSTDGHIYALPAVVTLDTARSEKHWINKKWLQKSKLKVPVTLEELKETLRVFKNTDMNGNGKQDEIPMTGRDIQQILDNFAGAFGLQIQMGYYLNIVDGRVEIWLSSERYRMLLQYLSELYREGLLDQDIFCSNYKVFLPKVHPDKIGVFHNQTDDIFSMYSDDFMGIAPWKGPLGDQLKNQYSIARDLGTFAITSLNKHPQITMKWIDYFYGQEGSLFFRMGVEGVTYEKKPDGTYDYTENIKNNKNGLSYAVGQFTIWPGMGAPHWINEQNSIGVDSENTRMAQAALKDYLVERVSNRPILDIKSEKRLSELKANIDMFVKASREKFIKGEFGFDKWDIYCDTLEKLGIKEMEQIYQRAYDTMEK